MSRLIARLALVLVAASVPAMAAAQQPWTLDDLRSGAKERIVGMSDQQAVDFYNRFHPRTPPPPPEPPPTVLNSPPATPPDHCGRRINPYADPAGALACVLASLPNDPPPALPVFETGRTYRDPYGDMEIVVLSVTRTLEGRTAVLGQVTKEDEPELIGSVLSFIVTAMEGKWQAVSR
jgi:hypothetical protein